MHRVRFLGVCSFGAASALAISVTARAGAQTPRAADIDGPESVNAQPANAGSSWDVGSTSPTRTQGVAERWSAAALLRGVRAQVLPRVSLSVAAGADRPWSQATGAYDLMSGVEVRLVDSRAVHIAASSGALREIGGQAGAWSRVSASGEVGRLKVGAIAHAEHVFGAGHDAVDSMASVAVSYPVLGPVRLGLDGVLEDMEGVAQSDVEGGSSMVVGPSAMVELAQRRLELRVGSATGFARGVPVTIERATLALSF